MGIVAYTFTERAAETTLPRYETFDVVDPNQLTAFLVREAKQLEIQRLDADGRMFSSIERFPPWP